MSEIPKMASIENVASETGLSKYAVRLLALSGKIAAVRVGRGKILINLDSVCRYLSDTKLTDDVPDESTKGGIRPVMQ